MYTPLRGMWFLVSRRPLCSLATFLPFVHVNALLSDGCCSFKRHSVKCMIKDKFSSQLSGLANGKFSSVKVIVLEKIR